MAQLFDDRFQKRDYIGFIVGDHYSHILSTFPISY
jgi:hypothetical protein